jgi:hypothetical protein
VVFNETNKPTSWPPPLQRTLKLSASPLLGTQLIALVTSFYTLKRLQRYEMCSIRVEGSKKQQASSFKPDSTCLLSLTT